MPMKKIMYFILPLILLAFLLNSCQPKVDIEKEKTAIKAVIDAETQAWIDKDGAKFADLYIHDGDQTRATLNDTAMSVQIGWSKFGNVADSVKNADWSQMKNPKFHHDFYNIKVIGNVAWAVFSQNFSAIYKGADYKSTSLQVMVLQKINGQWKISCFVDTKVPQPPPPPPPPPPPTEKGKKSK